MCEKMCCQDEHLVCTCMGVMTSEICEAIEQGATTFQALSDELFVGTGCTSCVDEVQDMLKKRVGK